MQSNKEIYEANATQCEVRAQEMPPGLRREFLTLAANWRKFADLAEAKDGKQDAESNTS